MRESTAKKTRFCIPPKATIFSRFFIRFCGIPTELVYDPLESSCVSATPAREGVVDKASVKRAYRLFGGPRLLRRLSGTATAAVSGDGGVGPRRRAMPTRRWYGERNT